MFWEDSLQLISQKYTLRLGDQSMLNILFGFNPDKGLEFPCNMNYMLLFCKFAGCRRDCCKAKVDGVECPEVEQHGIKVLHGASGIFQMNGIIPVGYAIYSEFSKFNYTEDFNGLKRRLSKRVNATQAADGYCIRTYNKHMRNIAP